MFKNGMRTREPLVRGDSENVEKNSDERTRSSRQGVMDFVLKWDKRREPDENQTRDFLPKMAVLDISLVFSRRTIVVVISTTWQAKLAQVGSAEVNTSPAVISMLEAKYR